jgi:hypothetical protein
LTMFGIERVSLTTNSWNYSIQSPLREPHRGASTEGVERLVLFGFHVSRTLHCYIQLTGAAFIECVTGIIYAPNFIKAQI